MLLELSAKACSVTIVCVGSLLSSKRKVDMPSTELASVDNAVVLVFEGFVTPRNKDFFSKAGYSSATVSSPGESPLVFLLANLF